VSLRARGLDGQRVDCAGPGWRLDELRLRLLGTYQPDNALLAVAAARVLGAGESAVREGLARAHWPGRFEVRRRRDGWLVLDGAHNPAGARALAASLQTYFGEAPVSLVTGVLRGKDAAGILQPLLARARHVVLTAFASPRALPPASLRAHVPASVPVAVAGSVGEALALAEEADRAVRSSAWPARWPWSATPCATSTAVILLARSKSPLLAWGLFSDEGFRDI
jgi:dihydrofolate synthase/folylpolyglutamate synthase